MAAYFNLNNNETSKELLVNKFNMILDNQGRLMLNDRSITSPHNKPQRSPEFVQKQPLEMFCRKRRLQQRCFPVKFAKVLRTPILQNSCKRLLFVYLKIL